MNLNESDYLKIGVKNSARYIYDLNIGLTKFEINTVPRLIAFFMNILHESGSMRFMEEQSSGKQYENNKGLGNIAKGDGERYKGRGLGQVTGRLNYTAFNHWAKGHGITVDFVANPEKLSEPQYAVLSAFWFWEVNNLSRLADNGDYRGVASVWNTGRVNSKKINGWHDRELQRMKIESWITGLLSGG